MCWHAVVSSPVALVVFQVLVFPPLEPHWVKHFQQIPCLASMVALRSVKGLQNLFASNELVTVKYVRRASLLSLLLLLGKAIEVNWPCYNSSSAPFPRGFFPSSPLTVTDRWKIIVMSVNTNVDPPPYTLLQHRQGHIKWQKGHRSHSTQTAVTVL